MIDSVNANGLSDRVNDVRLLHDLMFTVNVVVIEEPNFVCVVDTRALSTDFVVYYGDGLARGVS